MRNRLKTFEISKLDSKYDCNLSLSRNLDSHRNCSLSRKDCLSLVQIGVVIRVWEGIGLLIPSPNKGGWCHNLRIRVWVGLGLLVPSQNGSGWCHTYKRSVAFREFMRGRTFLKYSVRESMNLPKRLWETC